MKRPFVCFSQTYRSKQLFVFGEFTITDSNIDTLQFLVNNSSRTKVQVTCLMASALYTLPNPHPSMIIKITFFIFNVLFFLLSHVITKHVYLFLKFTIYPTSFCRLQLQNGYCFRLAKLHHLVIQFKVLTLAPSNKAIWHVFGCSERV